MTCSEALRPCKFSGDSWDGHFSSHHMQLEKRLNTTISTVGLSRGIPIGWSARYFTSPLWGTVTGGTSLSNLWMCNACHNGMRYTRRPNSLSKVLSTAWYPPESLTSVAFILPSSAKHHHTNQQCGDGSELANWYGMHRPLL